MSNVKFKDICKLVNVKAEKSVADFFLSDLEYCIRKKNSDAKSKVVSKAYKPSSLHCIRNMYYQLTGTEIDNIESSSDSVGIAESGTDRHLRIQEAVSSMKSYGIDCEYIDVESYIKQFDIPDLIVVERQGYETKLINTKYNFRFLCDGIIKYKGKYYVLEIKTEVSFKWNNRTDVDSNHYNQAITYSLNFNIPDVIFLYENRDNCAKKCYLYEVNENQKDEIKYLIAKCNNYVETQTLPDIPNHIKYNNKICSYCDYRKKCSAGVNNE